MAKLTLIYWRDIPAQIVIRSGRNTSKRLLSARFQEAIDRAAMRAGKTSSQDYMDDWRRSEPIDCAEDTQAQADKHLQELEAAYSDEDLLVLIRNQGKAQQ